MAKRLQFLIVLFAWFIATGAQWDLLQTLGWGSMIASHSRSMPFVKAVEKTFDGEMCAVCKLVKEAKQKEGSATLPEGKLKGKIILVFQPVPTVILAVPDADSWSRCDTEPFSAQRSAPPTPPPRSSEA